MVSPLGRIVEISAAGQAIRKVRGFLAVYTGQSEAGRVPLDDIGGVIVTARDAVFSTSLLAALAERAIPVVLTGSDFMPSVGIHPLVGHHAQGERFRAQIDGTRPLSKQLWAQLVIAKIERQGWALQMAGKEGGAFLRLARQVRSGDPANVEAQAARRYWPLLMGDNFRRDRNGGFANGMLNYGYAVICAATARAICAAGLHPGIGIFHRHRNNAMPLVDDLMEPFRPIVDVAVWQLVGAGREEVDREVKRALVSLLWSDEKTLEGTTPLATAIHRTAASLAESYLLRKASLHFPNMAPSHDAPNIERIQDHVDDLDV
jgi:CRISPR-associated protein Cas1